MLAMLFNIIPIKNLNLAEEKLSSELNHDFPI